VTHKKLQHGGPRKAVPPEVKAEAVRRALAGDDLKAIAADLGISVPAVSKWRVAAGGTKSETHHPTSEQVAAALRVLSGESKTQVAIEFGVCRETVKKWVRRWKSVAARKKAAAEAAKAEDAEAMERRAALAKKRAALERALAQLREENERRNLEATCWKPPTREEIERRKQEERKRVKAALRSWNPLRKLSEERGVIRHKED